VPDARPRRAFSLVAAALVLLLLGAAVAVGVSGTLGITFTPAAVPTEQPTAAPARAAVAPPAVRTLVIPDDPRVALAADAVVAALRQRGATAPTVVHATTATGPDDLLVRLIPTFAPSGEAFTLDRAASGLVLQAGAPAGAAAGLYTLADRIRSAAEVLPAGQAGAVQQPKLGLRLTDIGAVGLNADPAAFAGGTNYSLNSDVVGSALLPAAPWVDKAAVDAIATQFHQYVDHALTLGYNGVVVPGFLEYVTFSGVGDGHAVYPAGDSHVARARAMVDAFAPVWQYAHDMGMKVYFATDMLALSPPLERYLNRTVGSLDTTSPKLWSVYQAGLGELFASMPLADGLMIRVGEGGSAYHLPGWDYSSRVAVTTPAAVRAMLRAMLATAGSGNRDIIFRTWTVGLGAVGDLHTNPDSYATVLGGVDDPHLIVSTKYVAGDFYSYLPYNPTLKIGNQRRIIEFQSRREFEDFGGLPNDLGDQEQRALRELLAANPHIEGVWDWTQTGGPLYAGPRLLYLRAGLWQLIDLDAYLTARLAWDPQTDVGAATADWVRASFSADPATAGAIAQVLALSRSAITDGLYIGPFASQTVKALGLAPPPMMWIFEWDIVTGDTAVLDSIYAVSRGHLDEAIAQGERAVQTAQRMRELVGGTDPATFTDPALRQRLLDTLDYEVDLFSTLSAYRTMVLRHAQWLDTGSATADQQWRQARTAYLAARSAHVQRYGADTDLPAYNFTAADLGLARADRDVSMAWLARALLVALLGLLAVGLFAGRRGSGERTAGLHALWVGATQPWRVASLEAPASRTARLTVWLVPAIALVLSRLIYTWFASPAHLVVTLGAWLLFAVALALLTRGRDRYHLWAAVGGAALLRTVILLVALVTRGPGHYWMNFWIHPLLRSAYVTIAFAAFGWVFLAAWFVLRDRYRLAVRAALGRLLLAIGAPLAVLGGLIAVLGLERALTWWDDQMNLLPWGLHRILGITVYLGIPTILPTVAAVLGVLLMVAGGLLTAPCRRRPAPA
jgi:Glycosyl hydrolase family 67 C-terminus